MGSISSELKVVEIEGLKLREPIAIVGLPGPGFVGSSAAACLIINLDMFEVAHMESTRILPMKVIVGEQASSLHPFRIYRNLNGDMIVLRQEGLGVTSPSELFDIARAFVDWFEQKDVREILFLEGNPTRMETSETFFYSRDAKRLKELRDLGIRPLTEGYLSGIIPAMMDECTSREIPWTALLASTRSRNVDLKAVASLIDALNKILGLDVDPKVLLRGEGRRGRGGDLLRSIRRIIGR